MVPKHKVQVLAEDILNEIDYDIYKEYVNDGELFDDFVCFLDHHLEKGGFKYGN